jgi:hypothetical protein
MAQMFTDKSNNLIVNYTLAYSSTSVKIRDICGRKGKKSIRGFSTPPPNCAAHLYSTDSTEIAPTI